MIEREMILEILKKADITIFANQPCYLKIENDRSGGEHIIFEFSETGKLLSIWAWQINSYTSILKKN